MMSDAGSKNAKTASAPRRGDRASASVFDFIYHDARRIASFLAQFEEHGVLQQTKATEQAGNSATTRTGLQGTGKIPLVATGQIQVDQTNVSEDKDIAERIYDPLWRNARTLLDFLASEDLIQKIPGEAQIGEFVLFTGSLLLLDAAFLREAWDKKPFQHLLRAGFEESQVAEGNRQQRRSAASQKRGDTSSPVEMLLALLSMMPHAVQGRLIGDDINAWFTLEEQAIVGRSSDLILKHGTLVQGQWSVLGVMDALPGEPGEGEAEVLAEIAGSPIGQMAAAMQPIARNMMGRPSYAHGLTPLLIFRSVADPAGTA